MLNTSLREEPRDQRAGVIRSRHETSLLDWLESSGRLIARANQDEAADNFLVEDEEEITGLIDVDDATYDPLGDDEEPLDLED